MCRTFDCKLGSRKYSSCDSREHSYPTYCYIKARKSDVYINIYQVQNYVCRVNFDIAVAPSAIWAMSCDMIRSSCESHVNVGDGTRLEEREQQEAQ
jgi:hypothetical protein